MVIRNTNDLVAQHTLRTTVYCEGVGLHSGQSIAMCVRPAAADSGISFVRKDVPMDNGALRALWHNIEDTRRATVLRSEDGVTVRSVEHLMAALHAFGIDNAVIELDGPEVPAMDGSSRPFVTLIERAGVVRQNAARRVIKIHKPVTVCKDDAFAVLMPDNVARFTVQIDFRAPMIGFQRLSMDLRADSFKHEIADARTFGFAEQVGILRANGFALGGSLKNALVIDGDRLMNPEGVRSPDEFVRHKMLDCIGDLALAGTPILGHFFGYKPGHTLNSALLRELFVHEDSWSYTTFADALQIPAWRRLADARLADAMQLARSWWQKVA